MGNFKDVGSGHWARHFIDVASTEGLINGYPDGTFRPDEPITRAEAATILYNHLTQHHDYTPHEPEPPTPPEPEDPDETEPVIWLTTPAYAGPLDGETIESPTYRIEFRHGQIDRAAHFWVDGSHVMATGDEPYVFVGDLSDGQHTMDVMENGVVLATATFTVALAATPPTPDPDPPPVDVNEPFPANPDAILDPGDSIDAALSPLAVVELRPGPHGDQQITPRSGCYIFSRGQATLNGGMRPRRSPIPYDAPRADEVTLRGIRWTEWSPTAKDGGSKWNGTGAIYPPSGSEGWVFIDVEVDHSPYCGFRFRGRNHRLIRPHVHHCGQYMWAAGRDVEIIEPYAHHIGDGSDGIAPWQTSDRGICKMAAGTDNVTVVDTKAHDIGGKGLWVDGTAGRFSFIRGDIRRTAHNALSAEVAFGPVEFIGPFYLEDIGDDPHDKGYPIKAGIISAMTPNVYAENIHVVRPIVGSTVIYNRSHSVFDRGFGDISAAEARATLGADNVEFRNITTEGARLYAAAYTGGPGGPPRWTGANDYGIDPRFRWEGEDPIGETRWRQLAEA